MDPRTRRRLDVQGFDRVPERELASVAPWLRLAFGLCAALGAAATALASPIFLLALAAIAAAGAASPVHPFDLLYNHGVRRRTGTGPLPRRGAPSRFACGLGATMVTVEAGCFYAGYATAGYVLGVMLTATATLVATTDICIPSMIFRALFGPPRIRPSDEPG